MKNMDSGRREFLRRMTHSGGVMALGLLPASIQRALAIPARSEHRTLQDVQHVVILMQENRSFDHYFGTLRGVRGFGDRHTVPLASGRPVWYQSDGAREIPPFHLDTRTTSAIRAPGTPHAFSNAQAAWSQGQFGFWPKFKTPYSMGYYTRTDIPIRNENIWLRRTGSAARFVPGVSGPACRRMLFHRGAAEVG